MEDKPIREPTSTNKSYDIEILCAKKSKPARLKAIEFIE
jgi:hypothetical protein